MLNILNDYMPEEVTHSRYDPANVLVSYSSINISQSAFSISITGVTTKLASLCLKLLEKDLLLNPTQFGEYVNGFNELKGNVRTKHYNDLTTQILSIYNEISKLVETNGQRPVQTKRSQRYLKLNDSLKIRITNEELGTCNARMALHAANKTVTHRISHLQNMVTCLITISHFQTSWLLLCLENVTYENELEFVVYDSDTGEDPTMDCQWTGVCLTSCTNVCKEFL